MVLQININSKANGRRRMLLDFYDITKGGKIFFTLVAIYILFASITLPIIKYYLAKRSKSRNANDVSFFFFFFFFFLWLFLTIFEIFLILIFQKF